MEEEILEFWKENKIFTKWVRKNEGKKNFIFYEGPPTANGMPHMGHAMPRSVKDIIPRFKQMTGYHVYHRDGWDCQGLPVELEIEKKKGFSGKADIEKFGIAEFNELCKKSVFDYVDHWETFSKRLGYWSDTKNAYKTMDSEYIESEWWILKEIWNKNLLYKGYKVMPYCPRCGTTLSSHELAQGYKDVKDPSVFVEFEVLENDKDQESKNKSLNEFFIAWTTTPWTLPSNVALAVNKDENYVYVIQQTQDHNNSSGQKVFILAEKLVEKVFGKDNFKILKVVKGSELVGKKYNPLFDFGIKEEGKIYHEVVDADFVTMEDGSGIVHTAVAYGAEDFELGKKKNLGMFHFVDLQGKFVSETGKFAGMFVKDADKEIIKDLKERDLLFKKEDYEHSYPFCWRCKTPLIYYPIEAWFIATTKVKTQIQKANEKINWVPEHYKKGRMGNWLETMVDWNLSRSRYWGTPLPIWVSDDGEETICIGSFAELKEKAVNPELIGENFDPHKPFIDEIKLKSEKGKGELTRVPYVIDCWFDSGAMPFAQNHYPFSKKAFYPFEDQKINLSEALSFSSEKNQMPQDFPADYICEALDQTRGWFYTLIVISTILFGESSFKNVIVTNHGLDEKGQKQSKSLGNVLDPNIAMNEIGADALRWLIFSSDVTKPMRQSLNLVREQVKNMLLPLWNSVTFFLTYAEIDKYEPKIIQDTPKNELDKWILSRTFSLTEKTKIFLDNYDIWRATQEISKFLDDLNNWYIRLSRRRFWKSENDSDKMEAYDTLWFVLISFSKILAPFIPFTAEKIYQSIKNQDGKESVHLEDWPDVPKKFFNQLLESNISLNRDLVSFGLSARASSGVKLRQPLAKATFVVGDQKNFVSEEILKNELNVKSIEFIDDLNSMDSFMDSIKIKLNFSILGEKYGKAMPVIQDLIKNREFKIDWQNKKIFLGENIKNEKTNYMIKKNTRFTIEFGSEADLEFEKNVYGDSNKNLFVKLDTKITKDLKNEGIARDFIRLVQQERKIKNFSVSSRIKLLYTTKDLELQDAIKEYSNLIMSETLSENINFVPKLETKKLFIEKKEVQIDFDSNFKEQNLI